MSAPLALIRDAAVREEAEEAMLRLRVGSSNRVLAGVLGAGAILVALAWSSAHWTWLASWFVLLLLSQLFRIWSETHAGQQGSGRPLHQRIGLASMSALCSGAVQALSVGFFPLEDAFAQSLHTLILLVISTGAVVYTAGHPRTYLPFMIPIMLGLALAWWTLSSASEERGWLALGFGALILVYAYNLLGYARDTWTMFLNAAAMRHHEVLQSQRLSVAVQEAEAASHAKTRFLAAASHDLRQPIHTIALLAGVLKLRHANGESAEVVALLDTVVQSLSRQLDDLLDISKLDAGVVKTSLQPLKLSRFLQSRLDEVRNDATAKHLHLRLEASLSVTVLTDPNLLERIMRNLLNNAVKFTEQGEIAVRLSTQNNQAIICVSDTGCGIAPERQREVFQEFVQLSNPERDRTKGMGLGLSIVERLCRLLAIDMRMWSVVEAGTVFELRLPLHEAASPPRPPPPVAQQPSRLGLQVIVVDDERSVRSATAWLLSEVGCECLLAEDLNGAMEIARRQKPDVVLADYRLRGEETGIAVVQALRAIFPEMPAAIISGDIGPDQLRDIEHAGLALMHKPLRADTLLEWLRTCNLESVPAEERNE